MKNRSTGELDPPLRRAKGRMIPTSEPGDPLFVGTFKTRSLVP